MRNIIKVFDLDPRPVEFMSAAFALAWGALMLLVDHGPFVTHPTYLLLSQVWSANEPWGVLFLLLAAGQLSMVFRYCHRVAAWIDFGAGGAWAFATASFFVMQWPNLTIGVFLYTIIAVAQLWAGMVRVALNANAGNHYV